MKYKINTAKALTRKAKMRIFLRWFFYALVLLFFYMIMSCGAFITWQPKLIIPLAISVAMFEREFSSSVFAVFCGFILDIAGGMLFGFTSVWLMPCALAASLLVVNWIRVNFVNQLWLSAVSCAIIGFMDYLFNYMIWDKPNSEIVLTGFILPSMISTVILSPAVYFLVKLIAGKFGEKENRELNEAVEDKEEEEVKVKV